MYQHTPDFYGEDSIPRPPIALSPILRPGGLPPMIVVNIFQPFMPTPQKVSTAAVANLNMIHPPTLGAEDGNKTFMVSGRDDLKSMGLKGNNQNKNRAVNSYPVFPNEVKTQMNTDEEEFNNISNKETKNGSQVSKKYGAPNKEYGITQGSSEGIDCKNTDRIPDNKH
ncbi:unnamed protein product, partial [Mesorhabditis spiculigera]